MLTAVMVVWTLALFARYPLPFADLPQHAWTLAMLRNPEVYADAFVTTLRPWHTNSLWFVLDGALAPVLSPEGSLALGCALAVVALPLALAAWAHALGRSATLALALGGWVAWTRTLYWGFVNYTLSLPVAIATLALDETLGHKGPGRWAARRWGVAALLVGVYLLHAQTWAFLLGALVLQRLVRAGGFGQRVWRVVEAGLLALPSLLLFLPFLLSDLVEPQKGEAPLASLAGGLKAKFPEVKVVLDFLLVNATATVKWTETDERLAKGLLLAAGVGVLRALWVRSDSGRRGLVGAVGLAGTALLLYLYLPMNVLGQFQISTRMAPWVMLALVPAACPVLTGWRHGLLWVIYAAGALVTLDQHNTTLVRFERESAPGFAVLDQIPPGKRVAFWSDLRTSRVAYGAVYVHFLGWYAERGLGREVFSFAEFRPNPVVYRDPLHYPRAVAGEETRPWCAAFAGDGLGLDYVVTRGDTRPGSRDAVATCEAVNVYKDALVEVARVRDWALYQVTGPLPRVRVPGCACGSRAPRVGGARLP